MHASRVGNTGYKAFPYLSLEIDDFHGRPLAFVDIDTTVRNAAEQLLPPGQFRQRVRAETLVYKSDGTFDHAVRSCEDSEPRPCPDWTGSVDIPFTIPVLYDGFGLPVAQGIIASLVGELTDAPGFPATIDFIGTATLSLAPPDGITVTLASGQVFGAPPVNLAPIASAGADQTANEGAGVPLALTVSAAVFGTESARAPPRGWPARRCARPRLRACRPS